MKLLSDFTNDCQYWHAVNWPDRDAFYRVLEAMLEAGDYDPREIGEFFIQAWRDRWGMEDPAGCDRVAEYYERVAQAVHRFHRDETLIQYRRFVQEHSAQ